MLVSNCFYNYHEFFSLNENNDIMSNISLFNNDTSGSSDMSFVSEAPTELDYATTNSTMPNLSNITSEIMEEEEEEEEVEAEEGEEEEYGEMSEGGQQPDAIQHNHPEDGDGHYSDG